MEKVHVEVINRIRADILRETGLNVEMTDPIFTAILAFQFSQVGALTKMNELSSRLEKATVNLEKMRVGNGTLGGPVHHPYQFGVLLFGMVLGAIVLAAIQYLIH